MREYSQFRSSFWTGETGKLLRSNPDAQRLAAYLITSPHANVIGFYWLPIAYAASETGLSDKGVRDALVTLSEMGFAHYDAVAEFVWVVNMAREQLGLADVDVLSSKDNRGKGARRAAELGKRSSLHPSFVAAYGRALEIEPTRPLVARISKPLASPSATPFEGGNDRIGREGEGKGKGTENIRPSLGADAPDLPADEALPPADEPRAVAPSVPPEPPGRPDRELVAELQARYRTSLVVAARDACALSRRNGKMADSVWLTTLKALASFSVPAVEAAMRTFAERHADGQKDERYLVGIARGNARGTGLARASPGSRGVAPPARADEFTETPLTAFFEDTEAE